MAMKRKKAAKKAKPTKTKRTVKKAAARKAPARKAKAAPKKKAKKKSWVTKAVASVSKLVTGKKAKKAPAKREIGEGNYAASKRFRDKEEAFIKANKAKIPAMAKAAETALDGPEGDELRAAEASTAARGEGMD